MFHGTGEISITYCPKVKMTDRTVVGSHIPPPYDGVSFPHGASGSRSRAFWTILPLSGVFIETRRQYPSNGSKDDLIWYGNPMAAPAETLEALQARGPRRGMVVDTSGVLCAQRGAARRRPGARADVAMCSRQRWTPASAEPRCETRQPSPQWGSPNQLETDGSRGCPAEGDQHGLPATAAR